MCGTNPLNRQAIYPASPLNSGGNLIFDAENRSAKNWIITSLSDANIAFQSFIEGGIYTINILDDSPANTWTLPANAFFMPGNTGTVSLTWSGTEMKVLKVILIGGVYYLFWSTSEAPDLSSYLPKLVTIQRKDNTVTNYQLQTTDNATIICFEAAVAINVELPNNLPSGFNVGIIQDGAGQITFNAEAGATLHNRQTHTKTAGQRAAVSLLVNKNSSGVLAIYNLAGDTAA